MKIIMVGPIDTKGRYAGGIANIMNAMKEREKDFADAELSVNWFNSFRIHRSQYGNGKINIQNINNSYRIMRDLKREIRITLPDLVYYHTSVGLALLKDLLILQSLKNVKKVIHIHYADIDKILSSNNLVKTITLLLLKSVPDHIVTLSERTKEELINKGVDRNRISVIYNFHTYSFKEKEILQKIESMLKRDYLKLLYLGSIDSRKGILDLTTCLEDIGIKYQLDICGIPINKEIQNELEKSISLLPQGNVVCHGFVEGSEKRRLLLDTDVLVLPSYGEGFPIVLLEAIAAGNAIISTNVGAIPEVFDNDNGYIIKPGSKKLLRQSIIDINNKKQLEIMMKNNYKLSGSFNISSFINSVISVCEREYNND